MVTENVDIRFRETGARVVKRRVDEIGFAADRATRGVFLLQRALFVLGGFGIARALQQQADLLTNVENRLRLTTSSTKNLEAVQSQLFRVARQSRTSFESVAEVYSRTALSVRQLGISQQETIRFTESLSKAAILSGASTREANAALIQLSQGLSSNRLSGDELRSVLEQLPFVADVIAQQLGITRGELRKFGSEGKISANVVLEAFRNAQGQIDTLFAQTTPTIQQSFNVLQTSFLQLLDTFDDATGATASIANGIIFLSDNIESLVLVVSGLGVALAASFAAPYIQALGSYILGLRAASVASSRLLEIETLRAASSVRRTSASVAANASRQRELSQRLALLAAKKADLQQTILDTQFTVANGLARNASTGQFVNLTAAKVALARASQQLSIIEGVEAATATRLATARAAQTGATTAATGATARLAAAQAASSGIFARLTRVFPLFSGAIRAVIAGLRIFISIVSKLNPITAFISVIVAIGLALFRARDSIVKFGSATASVRQIVTLAFQKIGKLIAPLKNALDNLWNGLKNNVTSAINTGISQLARLIPYAKIVFNFLNAIVVTYKDVFVGSFKVILAVALDVFNSIKAIGASIFAGIGEAAKGNFSEAGRLFGEAFTDGIKIDETTTAISGIASKIGSNFSRDFFGDYSKAIEDFVREAGALRLNVPGNLNPAGPPAPGAGGTGTGSASKTLNDLQKAFNDLMQRTIGIYRDLRIEQLALDFAQQRGLITQDQYANNIDRIRISLAKMANESVRNATSIAAVNQEILNLKVSSGDGSFTDAFLLGISKMTESVQNFSSSAGTLFSDFFSGLTDGFSNSVGRAIVYSEDLGSSLKSVAKEGLASIISGLVKLGTQWLLNATLGASIGAASLAATSAQATAAAAAWAPAAALASLATGGTNALAANAAIASTVAASTALAGLPKFAEGGYFRGVGTARSDSNIARISDGEFIVNSRATAKNRNTLEAINSGKTVNGGVTVEVFNYGNSDIKVEKISENRIRIIAREEASREVNNTTPDLVSSQIENPNSQISRSLSANTTIERNR